MPRTQSLFHRKLKQGRNSISYCAYTVTRATGMTQHVIQLLCYACSKGIGSIGEKNTRYRYQADTNADTVDIGTDTDTDTDTSIGATVFSRIFLHVYQKTQ
jgi:hypothetical protein